MPLAEATAFMFSKPLFTTVVAKPPPPTRPIKADDIPFGPEAKDMTAEEAGGFGLV